MFPLARSRHHYYAMGMTEEEINQPLVGVVFDEAAPCNITLNRQAQAAGVAEMPAPRGIHHHHRY